MRAADTLHTASLQATALGLLFGAIAVSSGCFSPTYQEGLACSESGDCPGNQRCISGSCTNGTGGGADASDLIAADASSLTPNDAASTEPDAAVCQPGSQTFVYTGATETYVIPDCATSMHIEAAGGQGGGGRDSTGGGGLGARISGDFSISGGKTLTILVGGQGLDAEPGPSLLLEQGGGTGGGGSFVVDELGTPLIIAGGGGGATHTGVIGMGGAVVEEVLIPGGPGQAGENGQSGGGSMPGAGGTGGSGGVTAPNTGFHAGTGAGGFTGNGVGVTNGNTGSFGSPNAPGSGFQQGGAGGIAGDRGRNGAYGGGGSAGFTGGGGGGYSGGGGGDNDGAHGGGGGGSFNAGDNPVNEAGVHSGSGTVTVSYE